MISVRPAHFDADAEQMVNILQANLPYRPHVHFFRWLYRQNPEGEALAWVAIRSNVQRVVGIAVAFPKRINWGGTEARGYLLGDFCIDPEYRSLGLALRLQRACLDGLAAGDADCAFDFPSRSMMAIYNRLHIDVNQSVIRYVKVLRADGQIETRVPARTIARGLSAVANTYLRFQDGVARHTGEWAIALEESPWGDEFTAATRNWSPLNGISVARTAEYLNWRYRGHPLQNYEMLSARRNGKLGGYLICHFNGTSCIINDLLTEDDSAFEALLRAVVRLGRAEGAHTISTPWLAADPVSRLLRKYGFRPRESSPVLLLPFKRQGRSGSELRSGGYYLAHGDWEL
jgi:GNAT superfamily N-acetyltransferase